MASPPPGPDLLDPPQLLKGFVIWDQLLDASHTTSSSDSADLGRLGSDESKERTYEEA